MKKLISIILLCATAVLLCACGFRGAGQIQTPAAAQYRRCRPLSGSDTQAAADAPEEKAAENEQKIIAESYIGKEVSELYDAIGEPESVSYASSCLGSGEDGELVYNGFTVYTYKEGDSEVVQNVQ